MRLRSMHRSLMIALFSPSLLLQPVFASQDSPLPPPQLPSTGPDLLNTCGQASQQLKTLSEIQGTEDQSPLAGKEVIVEAIVSAVFTEKSQLGGYFLIEDAEDQDESSKTSEGIFVYDKNPAKSIRPYTRVRLQATVKEYHGWTELTGVKNLSVCGQVDQLPAAPLLPIPFNQKSDLEAFESMPIRWPAEGLTITDLYNYGRFGSITLASEALYIPTQVAAPGKAAQAVMANNKLKQITLDDASLKQNPETLPLPSPNFSASNRLRVGDRLVAGDKSSQNEAAILYYSHNEYRLAATQPLQVMKTDNPELQPKKNENDIRIVSFNVLNFFNGDGNGNAFPTPRGAHTLDELNRQQSKIIAALKELNADVIGLMEIENDGYNNQSALAQLTSALANTTGRQYQYIRPEGLNKLGDDAISVALVYDVDRLQLKGAAEALLGAPFNHYNRVPIGQAFIDPNTQNTFKVVVNHWKSKGCNKASGANADQQDGQGCWNPIRLEAAIAIQHWLKDEANAVVMGDLNAYRNEAPIQHLINSGFTHLLPEKAFTYVFKGERGTLDHALANPGFAEKVQQAQVWSINAAEARILDYNLEHKSEQQKNDYYQPDAYRSSDHDPVVIDIAFNTKISKPTDSNDTVKNSKSNVKTESKSGGSLPAPALALSLMLLGVRRNQH